jgi:predicted MFS family arabinose efflux permease
VTGGQLEHFFGWRSAFYLVGVPGLVLAVLVLLIEEPARRTATEDARPTGFPVGKLLAIATYRDAVLGYVA